MITIKTTGFKELADKLKEMPDNVMKNYVRRAEYQAAILVRDKARDLAPMHAGPYPATRGKSMSAKALATALEKAEKYGVTADDVRTKTAGLAGKSKGNSTRVPGTLKKSITIGNSRERATRNIRNDKNFVILSVGLMKRAYYGYFIEMGFMHAGKNTKTHVPAHPFLRPAFDSQVPALIDKFKAALVDFTKDAERG